MRRLIFSTLILLLSVGLMGCGEDLIHPQTLILNREGNKALQAQNAQEAYEKYLGALRFNPYQPELHLNLGLGFEFLQFPDKALQSYKYADQLAQKSENLGASFAARFNAGQLLGKAKKVDEALDFYQKALDIVPNSKETKHNIELLTQQQQGQGGGAGSEDQKDPNKDQKQDQQSKDGKGDNKEKDQKDQQDPKDQDDKKKDEPKDKEKENKKVQGSPKYQPRPFNGKELNEGDVKKILGEIKQQEQRIRADFNRKETKEQPRDKDW